MKKWIPNLFYVFEYDQLAQYLEQQAQKGWILSKVGPLGFGFRKEEPKRKRYCVDVPSVRRKRGGRTDYLDAYYQMCEEAGWTLVGTNMLQHIFVTEDPGLAPLHTDPEAQYQAVRSDIGPRMFAAVIGLVILYCMRLESISNWVYIPPVPRILFTIIFVLGVLMDVEMIYRYVQWKKHHEEIQFGMGWEQPLSLWPIRLRAVIYVLMWGLLVGLMVPLVKEMGADLDGTGFWSGAKEILGNPATMLIFYGLSSYVVSRILWKKGYDDKSGRVIGICVGFVVLLLLLGITYEMEEYIERKEAGILDLEDMDSIEKPPLTEEMLGLTASYQAMYRREEDETSAVGSYSVMLTTGGYLNYEYYVYREETEAEYVWNILYKRYVDYVERYTGEDTLYHYEWLERELSGVSADQALAVMSIQSEGTFTHYIYILRKGAVYWSIDYMSETPLDENQLQVISDVLS